MKIKVLNHQSPQGGKTSIYEDQQNEKGAAHIPVLADEVLSAICADPDGVYVDATFGAGGHSGKILGHLGAGGQLVALDCDSRAEILARQIDDRRFKFVRANFCSLHEMLSGLGIFGVQGVLMDLGLSAMQLADSSRGFSFSATGPLDMRMDEDAGESLGVWLRKISERALGRALREFGEERKARKIASSIIRLRDAGKLSTTADIASICVGASGGKYQRIHPATRTFQALRIAVNKELDMLAQGLAAAGEVLKSGGKLAVISFHSLEDRMVKRFLRPPGGMSGVLRAHGKLVRPGDEEIRANPRARSARLRVGEKL